MIDRSHELPVTQQARALGINRGGVNYLPKPASAIELAIVRPNQVRVTEVSYIPMARGFVYLVAIVDRFSLRVLAWRVSISLDVSFCIKALTRIFPATG